MPAPDSKNLRGEGLDSANSSDVFLTEAVEGCAGAESESARPDDAADAPKASLFTAGPAKSSKRRRSGRVVVIAAAVLGLVLIVLGISLGISLDKSGKTAWPECIGISGEECKALILKERPGLMVRIGPSNGVYTADFREDRVRIMVDEEGTITKVPTIG